MFSEKATLSPMLLPWQQTEDSGKLCSSSNDALLHTSGNYLQGALDKGPQHYRVS